MELRDPRQARPRYQLLTLGRLALLDPDGAEDASLGRRPRKLALLAYLALRGRPLTRDHLVELFWGGKDDDRARNSLSDALSHIRRALGRDAIVATVTEVRLAPPCPLTIDARELALAVERQDWPAAIALYGGPFLDGVHVDDSPGFEQWSSAERERLRRLFTRACAPQAHAAARARAWDACGELAARWLDAEPASADAAVYRLNAIKAAGTTEALVAALAEHERLSLRLAEEVGTRPDASVESLASSIRATLAERTAPLATRTPTVVAELAMPAAPVPTIATPTVQPDERARHPLPPPSTRAGRRARRAAVIAAAVLMLAGTVGVARSLAGHGDATVQQRRVAVLAFANETGDTTLDRLGRMAADWVAQGLSQAGIDVIPAIEVRRSLASGDAATGDALAFAEKVAGETGAGIIVTGAVYRQGDSLWFQSRTTDVGDGRLLRAVAPAASPVAAPLVGVDTLRQRVMAQVAAHLDVRLATLGESYGRPPTYTAYQKWLEGIDLFMRRDWDAAVPTLLDAWALDSTFYTALLWAGAAARNGGRFEQADSLYAIVARHRDRLAPLDRHMLDGHQAGRVGDLTGRLKAARLMAEAAPGSQLANYQVALYAMQVGRPRESIEANLRMNPQQGWMPEWNMYWPLLTHAHHVLGEHREELTRARAARTQYPADLSALEYEVRARAALGDTASVARLLEQCLALPTQRRGGTTWTPGVVMRNAALELAAHGHPDAARAAAERALAWELDQRPRNPAALAITYVRLERWAEARALYDSLAARDSTSVSNAGLRAIVAARSGDRATAERIAARLPSMVRPVPTQFGVDRFWQARIAAALGERERAVRLLEEAYRLGLPYSIAHHTEQELAPLRGYAPFDALMRPRG
jgi:DNA-binding SARP family transcriptional activator/tetratricopeptide (TPR) repeat protein/TolB-like protein